MRFWHDRHIGPLLTVWAAALLCAGALYWVQQLQPALDDVIAPLYIVTLLLVLWATFKWFRERNRSPDRRRADRRHSARRED